MSDLDRPSCRLVIRISLSGAGLTSSGMERRTSASRLRSRGAIAPPRGSWAVLSIGRRKRGGYVSSVAGESVVGVVVLRRTDGRLELPDVADADVLPVVLEDRLRVGPSALRHQRRDVVSPIRRSGPPERARRDSIRVMLAED